MQPSKMFKHNLLKKKKKLLNYLIEEAEIS